jgi:hypothetical protein
LNGGLQGPHTVSDVCDLSVAIHQRLHHLESPGVLVLLQGHFPPQAGDGRQIGELPEEPRIQMGHAFLEIDEMV